MQRIHFEARLLQQFAARCLLGCLANLLCTAWQCPRADIGRLAAAHQQNGVILDDHDPDPDDRPGGIFAIAHCLGASAGGLVGQASPAAVPSGHRATAPGPSASRPQADRSTQPAVRSICPPRPWSCHFPWPRNRAQMSLSPLNTVAVTSRPSLVVYTDWPILSPTGCLSVCTSSNVSSSSPRSTSSSL